MKYLFKLIIISIPFIGILYQVTSYTKNNGTYLAGYCPQSIVVKEKGKLSESIKLLNLTSVILYLLAEHPNAQPGTYTFYQSNYFLLPPSTNAINCEYLNAAASISTPSSIIYYTRDPNTPFAGKGGAWTGSVIEGATCKQANARSCPFSMQAP